MMTAAKEGHTQGLRISEVTAAERKAGISARGQEEKEGGRESEQVPSKELQ